MENEINKLKKEYDQASPPIFLVENGIHDLWRRVNNQNKYFNSKIFKYVMLGMLALLVSSGLIGAVSTQATADSALYPVKILTQKAVSTISNATLNTLTKSQEIIYRNVNPKPDLPTSTIDIEEEKMEIEEKEEDEKNVQNENQKQERERAQEQNSKSEDVEGENTNELNKNEDSSRISRDENESNQERENESE